MEKKLHRGTLCVQAGWTPKKGEPRVLPIYQSTTFKYETSEQMARLFDLEESGYFYTRLQNPTNDAVAAKIAALEGGVAGMLTSSGQAASFYSVFNICSAGDHVVSASTIYGGTYNLFGVTLPKLGIEVTFVDQDASEEEIARAFRPNTKALFGETISNPGVAVLDIEKFARIAHGHGVPLIVDNTFGAGGYLCRPIEYGAAVVVESATKWLGGHGTSMGGVIVEGGTYDWNNGKYPMLSEPSESYHGLRFTETFGQLAFIAKCRAEGVRDLGCCISPFNSFMIMQGIETLSLRVQREADNALALARYFKAHPLVEQVFYPGLEDDPHHELAARYLRHGFGCVLSVVLKGDKRQTESLVDHLRLVSHLANVGDNRTLIIQPAATTHSQLSEEEQRAAGVLPTLLRISAGIEHIDDLIRDFEQAFFYVKA